MSKDRETTGWSLTWKMSESEAPHCSLAFMDGLGAGTKYLRKRNVGTGRVGFAWWLHRYSQSLNSIDLSVVKHDLCHIKLMEEQSESFRGKERKEL